MTTKAQEIKTVKGMLRISARGYWFTAGGEKGSFGYYPHLRDHAGRPVYPDTQLHGDLKMAARWLAGLGAIKHEQVAALFGAGGGDEHAVSVPAKLFIGDLVLTKNSAAQWKANRFEVKPRIQINDDTRTVDEHFLVDLELARLEKLTLEAPIFITAKAHELKPAQELIQDAARLLSGFGAFRSRGYGRGTIGEIKWEPVAPAGGKLPSGTVRYALMALVNVRNKPIDPGSAQVISTSPAITAGQLKGWLARAYQAAHDKGEWPTPAQMSTVVVSPLYPAPDVNTLSWPAPMTSLRDEDGKLKDQWGIKREEDQDNFFCGKTKPLGARFVVTETGNAWEVDRKRRIRNRTNDTFATIESGLFVQEFLPAGTVFTGTIYLDGAEASFAERIWRLLAHETPCLKGAVFSPACGDAVPAATPSKDKKPFLVVEPIPYRPELIADQNSLTLATMRGYNTTLKRPRRGRVTIQPGSILAACEQGAVFWPGLGNPLDLLPDPKQSLPREKQEPTSAPAPAIPLNDELKKLSRAQAGLLRAMLHPALSKKPLSNSLDHRIKKYTEKPKAQPALLELLTKIKAILDDKE